MIDKADFVKNKFKLIKGIDYEEDYELNAYICAIDSYLEAICMTSADLFTYSDEIEDELSDISVDVFPSAMEAYTSLTGIDTLLTECGALDALLNDGRVAYMYDAPDFFVLFFND